MLFWIKSKSGKLEKRFQFKALCFWSASLATLLTGGCANPFAPGLEAGDPFDALLGDPRSLDGFYLRFQNAYQFRDTTLYGPLIDPEFMFTYRDFEQNVDISWGRPAELNSTWRLFNQSQDLQLQWNNLVSSSVNPEKTEAVLLRRFNLGVVLNAAENYRTDGVAGFILRREDSTMAWRLYRWRDESNL
jgi:hypothetical protein